MTCGKVIGVGVGPGDPDLLTLKAIRVLQEAEVICAPTGDPATASLALSIITPILQARESTPQIITLHFPMVRNKTELQKAWTRNANTIAKLAKQGKQVAFIAIGDPTLYSTFTHIARVMKTNHPEIPVEIVPGIISISACAAKARIPLAFEDETLLIMPTPDMHLLKQESRLVDNIVWMKGVKELARIIKILKAAGFTDKSEIVIARRCSFSDEKVWKGRIQEAPHLRLADDYFTTMMVRRRPSDA